VAKHTRGIWSGSLSFGLVNIPVSVMSAKQEEHLHFHLLDKRDNAPIGYKQVNKATGREVSRQNIVKGYEYEPDQFVIVTPKDFEHANPKATRTIDIEDFIDLESLDPLLFEQPYYLVPGKNGEKGYLLLRKALAKTEKVAIARFVMRSKQHLVAVMARGEYLILETLRYAHEIREAKEAHYLEDVDLSKVRISDKEMKTAQALINGMSEDWKPEKYKDTYQDDLLKAIHRKIKTGDTETAADIDEKTEATDTNVVDLMPLLEQSLRKKPSRKSKTPTKQHRAHP
jgi:DNA end-binding protein Ku